MGRERDERRETKRIAKVTKNLINSYVKRVSEYRGIELTVLQKMTPERTGHPLAMITNDGMPLGISLNVSRVLWDLWSQGVRKRDSLIECVRLIESRFGVPPGEVKPETESFWKVPSKKASDDRSL